MSNGSYQAVVYGYPVHELVDGVWVEIESTNQNARGNVSPDSARSNILDNYVWEGHGVQDSDGVRLYIGNKSGYECQAYIQFATMPTIPAGATITTATMTVNIVSGTSTANNAKAFQVTGGEWTSSTLQWSNKPVANISLEENISHNNKTKYQFSCLAAVQHWYDGDTTGQNENYGIMLCYQDPEIADYNSFYSADCTDATMRPALTISYTPATNEVGMLPGRTYTLTVPDYTGEITWISSNPSVATVGADGMVTAIKVGGTTITASGDGNELIKFNVYVKIQDGVYYIKNTSGSYLGTSGQSANGTKTYLYTKATSGRALLNQLWRLDYLGQGNYSIRPLYNMSMALCSAGGAPGSVVITSVGTGAVPGAGRWSIYSSDAGFELYCAGTSYMTMCGEQSYPGSAVVTKNGSTNPSSRYWSLETAPDVSPQLLLMDVQTGTSVAGTKKYIDPGQTVTLEDLGITAAFVYLYSTNQDVVLLAPNSTAVSTDSIDDTITGLAPGAEATITVRHILNGTNYDSTIIICVNPILSGVYYIRSWACCNQYVDIRNQEMTHGSVIHQWDYNGGTTQQWVITHIGDGIYTICSSYNGANYYLGVSGDSSGNNVPIILRGGALTDGMKWRIDIAPSGAYKITALTGVGNNRVLALEAGLPGYMDNKGAVLHQRDYVEDENYPDEWLLCPVNNEYIIEGQQTPVWCWVASARIAAFGCMKSHISQASAAVYVKSSMKKLFPSASEIESATDAGRPVEAMQALAYITGRNDVFFASGMIYDEATLRSLLDYSIPIIIYRGWYKGSVRTGGHVTVICGYSWDSEEQLYRYRIVDPWPVNDGCSYYRSYKWICNGGDGTAVYDDKDDGIWESVILYKVGDYDNTINWPGVKEE